MTYRPLQSCEPQRSGESLAEYSSRVLCFFLVTDTTATLTDEQLELALTASTRAVTQTQDQDVLLILHAARRTILATLKFRRDDDTQAQTSRPAFTMPLDSPQGGPGGHPSPLIPPPITRPPSPAYATKGGRDDSPF